MAFGRHDGSESCGVRLRSFLLGAYEHDIPVVMIMIDGAYCLAARQCIAAGLAVEARDNRR